MIVIYFMIALLLFLSALAIRKHQPRQYGSSQHKSIPITGRRLVWNANKHAVFSILAMDFVFMLIFAVTYFTGRMEIIPALIACSVCFILALLIHLHVFVLQSSTWKMMKSIKDFYILTRGKTLEYDNGNWCYSDQSLVICIGRQSAFILYAPFVDFSKKIYYERNSSAISGPKTGSGMRYELIVVPLKDGGKSKQMLSFNRVAYEWIHSHGGCIIGAD